MPHSLIEHILSIIIAGFGWDVVHFTKLLNIWVNVKQREMYIIIQQ